MGTAHRALPAMLLAAAVLVSTPACAARYVEYRHVGDPGFGGARAYDIGYREGFEHGRDDGRQGRRLDYARHGDYRRADLGFRGGNRGLYRQAFRDGFAAGYNDAYRQFGRARYRRDDRRSSRVLRPSGFPTQIYGRASSPAAERGYRDGFTQGRDDARDGDPYDPRQSRRYREGDHDYDRRFGSRDAYKRDYRDAFTQGYEQGYRDGRR